MSFHVPCHECPAGEKRDAVTVAVNLEVVPGFIWRTPVCGVHRGAVKRTKQTGYTFDEITELDVRRHMDDTTRFPLKGADLDWQRARAKTLAGKP